MLQILNILRRWTIASGIAVLMLTYGDVANARRTFAVVHAFGGTDGETPNAKLIADQTGNFYGTTYTGGGGGGSNCNGVGCGEVFKIAADGTETVLYAFMGGSNDGAYPLAGLVADSAGNLYGTTSGGGHNGNVCEQNFPCGVVFKVAPDGTEQVLHTFQGQVDGDGNSPRAALIFDTANNLYGTTFLGGANGGGTVFKLTPQGSESVLYSFCGQANCADGYAPDAALVMDSVGNLYGTTTQGGANGEGEIFRLSPDGTETVLYSFCTDVGCADGFAPEGDLLMDNQNNFYGVTNYGGVNTGCGYSIRCGTVFRLAPDGTETVLYSFCSVSNCADGFEPDAGLTIDRKGNLYGTTISGGGTTGKAACPNGGCGTIFELAPNGTEKVIHRFSCRNSCSGGWSPEASLISANHYLYGTTPAGGEGGNNGECCGTVFKISN